MIKISSISLREALHYEEIFYVENFLFSISKVGERYETTSQAKPWLFGNCLIFNVREK